MALTEKNRNLLIAVAVLLGAGLILTKGKFDL